MPLSLCEKLELGELRPTTISLLLTNRFVRYPMGILEDVLIKVGDLYAPVDFVILEMKEDTRTPIILGRPFLATAGCRINVKNSTLTFDVGDVHVEFNFLRAAKFPSISDECNKIDVVDNLIQETTSNINDNDPLKHLMLNNSTTEDENSEVAECAQLLEASPPIPPSLIKVELLQDESNPLFDDAKAPEVELKPLPSLMRYEFLGPKSTYLVIINANLNTTQVNSLLRVLRKHRKAIGYTLDDLKGIHPSWCMHWIFMEDNHKPSIDHQRRLNPSMQDVVKKEIFKLLKADIIYPTSDSA